ncbi:MAG: hypothetical protein K2Q18_09015, partial [Bdellovibrionales bacterium]|nr:hypothetical protein [Bdellovibrionales bacterium]
TVASEILKSNKPLSKIYISQSDPDYYFSLKPILEKFPNAKVLAASDTIAAINKSVQKKIDVWGPQLKENGPQSLADIIIPSPYDDKYLTVGSSKIEIINTSIPNRRYLWSEELKAIFGGVLVFSDVHVWVADTASIEGRHEWIKILESIIALNPKAVIPGHMQPSSLIDATSVKYTIEYLKILEREQLKVKSSEELTKAMIGHYPNTGMDVALNIGAKVVLGEMKWG